ncbi:MAG: septal ring lytic transglycosylase RlpA family protein [Bacteroidaceae bacterium]|jgi:rare lipoprotein A|nr:septal ring lytic transglycosylase RlpA family protein [Bacteroidaceae bacterium]
MNIKKYTLVIAITASLAALAQVQNGKASYYSKKFSGRKTASGERLHHDSLTCAHRTYPFGTMLKVTNPSNGKQVVVRVTDRGPYVKGRIIDLSVRAAQEIGIIAQGIAPVIVERYNPSIVPFKPEDAFDDLPELEMGTNEGSDTTPIWMILRDQYRKESQLANSQKPK